MKWNSPFLSQKKKTKLGMLPKRKDPNDTIFPVDEEEEEKNQNKNNAYRGSVVFKKVFNNDEEDGEYVVPIL